MDKLRNAALLASVMLAGVVCLAGCKKPEETANASPAPNAPAEAGSPSVSRAVGIKVDRTAGQDGPLTNDSADDGVLTLAVDGPVSAVAVLSVDSVGKPIGGRQWDTVVAQQPMPAGWKTDFAHGVDTWQLGVEEGGKLLNTKSGTIAPLAAGPHELTLYLNDATLLSAGMHLIVLAERPDHSIVKSNILTM